MNRLHIDFAPFDIRRELYRAPAAVRSLTLAALLLCVLAGFRVHQLFHRIESLDREQARLAAQRAANAQQPMIAAHVSIDVKQSEAVNSAVAQLNLPWDDIFNAIEAATPPQVSLLSIQPEPRSAQLKIGAQSSGSDDMIAYLRALEQQPSVERVYLTKHEHVRDGFSEVLRFQIQVQWRRAAS